MRLQRGKSFRAEIVVIHFYANGHFLPAVGRNHLFGQIIHGMADRRLNIEIGIANQVIFLHINGAFRTINILPPPVPIGVAFQRQQHALVNVEAPAVITGQPGHVRWVRYDQ